MPLKRLSAIIGKPQLIRLGHTLTLFYGKVTPPLPGRWQIVSSLIRVFGLRRAHVVVARRRGVWFRLDLASYLDVLLYYSGYYDYAETRFIECNLKAGDVFFDVGANVGYYTMLAARKVAPIGEVHAFEISAQEITQLKANVALNDFASVVCINRTAISDFVGEVPITPTFGAGTTSIDVERRYLTDSVPTTTLDQYVREKGIRHVEFLKCDIEGAELMMLRGAHSLLAHLRPVILIELCPKALARFEASVREILFQLDYHEYGLYCLTKSLIGIQLRKMMESDEPRGEDFVNIVAIPRERLPQNSERLPLRLPDRA